MKLRIQIGNNEISIAKNRSKSAVKICFQNDFSIYRGRIASISFVAVCVKHPVVATTFSLAFSSGVWDFGKNDFFFLIASETWLTCVWDLNTLCGTKQSSLAWKKLKKKAFLAHFAQFLLNFLFFICNATSTVLAPCLVNIF